AQIGRQCVTTRTRCGNADAGSQAGATTCATMPQPAEVEPSKTQQLYLQSERQTQTDEQLKARLNAVTLRQARTGLKPHVTFGGVVDGEVTVQLATILPNKTSAFSGMTAKVEMRTRDGELRYQFADEEPSVYAWDSARLTADLQGEKLEGVFM